MISFPRQAGRRIITTTNNFRHNSDPTKLLAAFQAYPANTPLWLQKVKYALKDAGALNWSVDWGTRSLVIRIDDRRAEASVQTVMLHALTSKELATYIQLLAPDSCPGEFKYRIELVPHRVVIRD